MLSLLEIEISILVRSILFRLIAVISLMKTPHIL